MQTFHQMPRFWSGVAIEMVALLLIWAATASDNAFLGAVGGILVLAGLLQMVRTEPGMRG